MTQVKEWCIEKAKTYKKLQLHTCWEKTNKQAQTQTHIHNTLWLWGGVNPTRLDSWFWFWWAFLYQWYVWCNPLMTRSIPVPFRSLPLVWENNRCHVTLSHIVALPPKNQKSPLDSLTFCQLVRDERAVRSFRFGHHHRGERCDKAILQGHIQGPGCPAVSFLLSTYITFFTQKRGMVGIIPTVTA